MCGDQPMVSKNVVMIWRPVVAGSVGGNVALNGNDGPS